MAFISPGNWGLLNCPSPGNGPRWSFGYTGNLGPPGGTTEDLIFPGYGGGGRLKIGFKLSCCQCWRGVAWGVAACSCKAFSWRTAFFFCCCCCRIISRNFWRCLKKNSLRLTLQLTYFEVLYFTRLSLSEERSSSITTEKHYITIITSEVRRGIRLYKNAGKTEFLSPDLLLEHIVQTHFTS